MNNRPGETVVKTVAPGQTSGHKDRWRGEAPDRANFYCLLG